MPDPTVIECSTACTVTVVHELSLPPLQLTPEQGAVISSAVLLVWVAGWCIRMLVQLIRHSDSEPTEKEL